VIIAIVGMPGSGKSRLAEHIESRGFPTVRFGQIIIDELRRRGLDVNPESERVVREQIRAAEGMDVCASRSIPAIRAALDAGSTVIVDGLYSWAEYKTLKRAFGPQVLLVHVFAPRSVRYQRLKTREVRPLTEQEAEERDVLEIERIEKGGPIALADYVLLNEGTETQLLSAADNLLQRLVSMEIKVQN
jgi:dephospho-CoA kinase